MLGLSGPGLVLVSGRQAVAVVTSDQTLSFVIFELVVKVADREVDDSGPDRFRSASAGVVAAPPKRPTVPQLPLQNGSRPSPTWQRDDRMKDSPLPQAVIEQSYATLGAWPEG